MRMVRSPWPGMPGSERTMPRATMAMPSKFLAMMPSQRMTGWRSTQRLRWSAK